MAYPLKISRNVLSRKKLLTLPDKVKMKIWLPELIKHLKKLSPGGFLLKKCFKFLVSFTGRNLSWRHFFDKFAIKWSTKMVGSKFSIAVAAKVFLVDYKCWNFQVFLHIWFRTSHLQFSKNISVNLYLAGCEISLHNSRIASRFLESCELKFPLFRKFPNHLFLMINYFFPSKLLDLLWPVLYCGYELHISERIFWQSCLQGLLHCIYVSNKENILADLHCWNYTIMMGEVSLET